MRSDVAETADPRLALRIKQRQRRGVPLHAEAAVAAKDTPHRVETRIKSLEPKDRDPNGLERVLGTSDLLSLNFMLRGIRAAAAVARLRVRLPDGTGEWFGTGFLVAPGLLLTNHHVIPNAETAALAIAEFNYEHDLNGVEAPRRVFNLMPSSLFLADASYDASFVEVAPRAFDGTPLSEFGYLPLMPRTGKAIGGEWVSMIQHPGGQPKQVAIRNSQIVVLDPEDAETIAFDRFIHYTTDSEPGSSGAPVLNDQWQVLALHHRAVADYDSEGRRLARDGNSVWCEEMGEEEKGWVANEGVRVSAIYTMLAEQQFDRRAAGAVRQRLLYGLSSAPLTILSELPPPADDVPDVGTEADTAPPYFQGAAGYDPGFLSRRVPLPKVKAPEDRAKLAKLIGSNSDVELKYTHFSVVFDADRRFARFTAVNIDGATLKQNTSVTKPWRRDGRIDVTRQCNDDFYKQSIAVESVYFQRGHMVRRVDPSWGSPAVAKRAVEDTFHFTNAVPHVARFNNTLWGNLEDYLLDKCDRQYKRMVVFSGPLFRPSDPESYGRRRPGGPYKIPVEFWKVAVVQKTPTTIAAAAFKIGQGALLGGQERVFTGLNPFTPRELLDNGIQTKVATIEQETGLDFGILRKFDSVAGLESTFHVRPLLGPEDIII